MKVKLYFLLIILIKSSYIFSINNVSESLFYLIKPTISAGTHINSAGIQGQIGYRRDPGLNNRILSPGISLLATPRAYQSNLGIPGSSIGLDAGVNLFFSFGKRVNSVSNKRIYRELGRHTINYFGYVPFNC